MTMQDTDHLAAFIETGKKAKETGDRDATLKFGYHAFHVIDGVEELAEWAREQLKERPYHRAGCRAGHPIYTNGAVTGHEPCGCKLDRIRKFVKG